MKRVFRFTRFEILLQWRIVCRLDYVQMLGFGERQWSCLTERGGGQWLLQPSKRLEFDPSLTIRILKH